MLLRIPYATRIARPIRPAPIKNSTPFAASAPKLSPLFPCLARFDDEAEGATFVQTGTQSDRGRDEFACTCSCRSRLSPRSRIRYMDANLRRRAVEVRDVKRVGPSYRIGRSRVGFRLPVEVHWMTDAAVLELSMYGGRGPALRRC
ncbi:hypothetical protein Mapa_012564 [Marchantia paleacea]|nr:hypothetical protein Mapa_012564 [Marchantia paleacea]